MDVAGLTLSFEAVRAELTGYVRRLVVRPALAEELVQATYLRAYEALERCPDEPARFRAWLFRVATNAALDELRRHSTWRETTMQDLRADAESDPAFVSASRDLIGTPETAAVAKEHLAACFACMLRNFEPRKAAALLLKEVYGFGRDEIAQWLEASAGQVKNWLQETRVAIDERYGSTCALVAKDGVCYQCVELAEFFRAPALAPTTQATSWEARIAVLRDLRHQPPGAWHRLLLARLDDL